MLDRQGVVDIKKLLTKEFFDEEYLVTATLDTDAKT